MPQPAPAPRGDDHDADHQHELAELVQDDETAAAVLADIRRTLTDAGASEEVLQLLDSTGSPVEVVQQLIDAGVLTPPAESLTEMLEEWESLLDPDTEPVEAELCGYEFLAIVREDLADPTDLPRLLTELVTDVEQEGTEVALAMLRVLAVTAPASVRPAAAAAGDRLAASGVADCDWASQLGAPTPSRCFGYAGGGSNEEAVVLTFRYGRNRHAVVVEIDHQLGGGVKDVWVGDQPDELRAELQQTAAEIGAVFQDYEPEVAAGIAARALRQEPCPVEPDQREDVDIHLDLLRQRLSRLPAPPAG